MECETCKYETKSKANYERHLKSKSHLKKIKAFEKGDTIYSCTFCKKKYLCRTSLCRHKRICKKKIEKEIHEQLFKQEVIENLKQQLTAERAKNKKLEDEKKILNETNYTLAKNSGNNNNNKTTFNIQFFLDEKCKNAMPIMDFVKDLQFRLTDINPERPASTIESLSKCITDKLEKMGPDERPVHCTDQKRLVFHVKDASGWTKDINNQKIDEAMGYANNFHQQAWLKKAHDDDVTDDQMCRMNVAMGKWSDNPTKAKKKIKRAIAKNVYVTPEDLPQSWKDFPQTAIFQKQAS